MSRFRFYFRQLLPSFIIFILVYSCDEETEEAMQAYYGTWQTAVYSSYNLNAQLISEQMTFDFKNYEFEDIIAQGDDANSLEFASAIKGAISNITDSTMDIEITDLSVVEGIYINKELAPEDFQTAWDNSLGLIMVSEFDAKYIVDGESMQLILPVLYNSQEIQDTINLTKIE